MEISKAIKQERFNSNQEMALINLLFTCNWLRDQQNSIFKDFRILPQHYNVLRIVKGQYPEPVNVGYILDVMLDKGRDLTRLIDKLVAFGLLSREACKENRRKTNISITEKGIRISDDIKMRLYDWMESQKYLSDEEFEHLSFLLDKMRG
ncbi:MAG TPA: MarR family transcriptional regulator [Saprospiraceae bacterium]|nr:MarR family transcriptional regulator [Saprospiraceae bacterium]